MAYRHSNHKRYIGNQAACVNQLIQAQTKQQEPLAHVISNLTVTRYAAQVNRQKLNEIIDALQRLNDRF